MINEFVKLFQKEDLPDLEHFKDKSKYQVEGAYLKPLDEMIKLHDYKPVNDREVEKHNVTIYEPELLHDRVVIYVPGFGKNFSLFHLNREFEKHDASLIGIDLYSYGYTYYRNRPARYNTYDQEQFDANLDFVLDKYKSSRKIILTGNSTGATIIARYLNKRNSPSIDKVVLTNPAIPADTKSRLPPIPFLEDVLRFGNDHVPDLIVSNDANPVEFPYKNARLTIEDFRANPQMAPAEWTNWLHLALQPYNESEPEFEAHYDPLCSPIRNKSVTMSQLYNITVETPILFTIPTTLVFAGDPRLDKNIDIAAYRKRTWADNVNVVYVEKGFHEMLSSDKETVHSVIRDNILSVV